LPFLAANFAKRDWLAGGCHFRTQDKARAVADVLVERDSSY
jgi:hypothetical protein